MSRLFRLFLGVTTLLATVANPLGAQEDDSTFALVEIEVVDAEGKPLTEVAIDVEMDNLEFPIQVDDEGFGSLNLPTGSSLDLKFQLQGYVAQQVHWTRGSKIPDELRVTLQKGLPLGGIVHDDQGQPIEGVEISAKSLTRGFSRGSLQPYIQGAIAETDKHGRWEACVGTKQLIDMQIRIAHADYISLSLGNVDQKTYQEMRALKLATTLPKRLAPTGTVVDDQGQYRMEAVFFGPPNKGRAGKRRGVQIGNHFIPAAKEGEAEPFDLGESTMRVSKPVAAPQGVPTGEAK